MKTTIDIPDPVYREAKICAVRRGCSLKDLVVTSLERELHPERRARPVTNKTLRDRFRIDSGGWPVLQRRKGEKTIVTDEFINRLREEEGV